MFTCWLPFSLPHHFVHVLSTCKMNVQEHDLPVQLKPIILRSSHFLIHARSGLVKRDQVDQQLGRCIDISPSQV